MQNKARGRNLIFIATLAVLVILAHPSPYPEALTGLGPVKLAQAAAHTLRRERAYYTELQDDLDAIRQAIKQHMKDNPDDFDGREELWMEHENLRGMLRGLWRPV